MKEPIVYWKKLSASLIWSLSCTNNHRPEAEKVFLFQFKLQGQANWEKHVLLLQKNRASFSFAMIKHVLTEQKIASHFSVMYPSWFSPNL